MEPLTQEQVAAIQTGDQENQQYQVGQRIKDNEDGRVLVETDGLIAVELDVTADASGAIDFIMPGFDFELLDVTVLATAISVAGTLILRRGTTDMTDAIACSLTNALGRAAEIVIAEKSISAGETLNIISNGAGDRGRMNLIGRRI